MHGRLCKLLAALQSDNRDLHVESLGDVARHVTFYPKLSLSRVDDVHMSEASGSCTLSRHYS